MSPVLVAFPALFAFAWKALGGRQGSLRLAAVSLLAAVVPASFIIGDVGWVTDPQRRLGVTIPLLWPLLIVVASVPVLLTVGKRQRVVFFGSAFSLLAMLVVNAGIGGPGIEEAFLVIASLGAAIVVAVGLDSITRDPMAFLAIASGLAILVMSVGSMAGGRLGLLPGDENARFGYASTLAGSGGPGRILVISENRADIPGESRPGPGFWYRTLDGAGSTLDEMWLPAPQAGDEVLDEALAVIASGAELRPGRRLSEFAIEWVVVADGPASLKSVLAAQVDLIPTPLDPASDVFENPMAVPLAYDGLDAWQRSETGFVGDASSRRLGISANGDSGWRPAGGSQGWAVSVSAENGAAWYRAEGVGRVLPLAGIGLLVAAMSAVVLARFRR
jgi:hypothetical protein